MTISDLAYLDAAGTSSLLEANSAVDVNVDRAKHQRLIRPLVANAFWQGKGPTLGLWAHQQSAISHSIAYLCAETRLETELNVREAALLKLPTGTGKSGIIAIVSRCLSNVRRTLLLTPRKALSEQLLDDVKERFWNNIKFPPSSLAEALIERVLPNRVPALLTELKKAKRRVVL